MNNTRVYYYVPEQNRPSWGAGMIYYHVWLLNKNGIAASVLHDNKPFVLTWINLDLKFCYISDKNFKINNDDVLVIPEFDADHPQLKKLKCRKIVFVQNAYYIFDGLENGCKYEDLRIEQIFYYMPHLKKILQSITTLPLYETPPFIAPYFFSEIRPQRKRRIILYPKFTNREYDILKRMLKDRLGLGHKPILQKLLSRKSEWEILELKDKQHHEVAKEMQESEFFISLNTTEAFNSSVPEAMAAGCINVCYEGVGPADFLENNVNAFVFQNNHIFPLAEKVIKLVEEFERIQPELEIIRLKGYETANKYRIENLENSLVHFFGHKIQIVKEN